MSKKILFADDDPAILDSTKLLLELEGFEVETRNEAGSVYKIKKDLPDLFLLDIWMSGHDGRDLCRFLKKNEITKNIPVIMISAGREIEKSLSESGADDYITKPYEMSELIAKIRRNLR